MRAVPPQCLVRYAIVNGGTVVALIAAGAAFVGSAGAQGVRVNGVSAMQLVDVRPLVEDSVPIGQASGTGPYRLLPDGTVVRCVAGDAYCRFLSSGTRKTAAPLVQDLRAVVWGLGQGISAQAHVRARGSLGSADATWPRADDHFDAIEAWLEMDREQWRARLGRQWTTGGLGLYNYDGGSLLFRPGRARIDVFGGRSLVVGLNEPATGPELGAVDDLPPDEDGWLIGASAVVPFGTRGSVAGTYQRVIRADQAALYSERIAGDISWLLFGGSADAALAYDISALEVNDASLQFARPIGRGVAGSVELRRHRPFFDAWTIWGAFSPVAFDEARAELTWRNTAGNIGVDVRGAWRAYGETNAGLESTPLRTDGWRAGAGAEWLPRQAWMFYADYDVDIGFGASRSDIAAGARWMPDESRWLGLVANGLQHIYEFRVGTGRIIGLRLEGGTRITPDVRLLADLALYDHHLTEGAAGPDWSQRRFSVRLDWTVGRDPGTAGLPGIPP